MAGTERATNRSSIAVVAAVSALVLAAAGCTVTTTTTASTTTTAATAATTTAATTTTTTATTTSRADGSTSVPPSTWPEDQLHHVAPTPATDALAAKMIDEIPGYALQPDRVGDTGPSDLAKAADDDGGGVAARALLTRLGFTAGYQRLFRNDDASVTIVLFLYRFDDADGATAYARHWQSEFTGPTPESGVTRSAPKSVPGLDGALEVTVRDDHGNTSQMVVFAKGDHVASVLVQATTDAEPEPPSAADLAVEQSKRL